MPEPRRIFTSQTPLLSRYNGTGSDIAANLVVMDDATTTDGIKLPAGIDSMILGATTRIIKAGEWGDIAAAPGSIIPLKNTGGVTKGDRLMPQTDGTVATWAASTGVNATVCGIAQETKATTLVGECQLAAPGTSRQG